jgi:hypothetical protein
VPKRLLNGKDSHPNSLLPLDVVHLLLIVVHILLHNVDNDTCIHIAAIYMARRPPSSAYSRPVTSNGPHPNSSAGHSAFYDHTGPRYTYGEDYALEEEEDESDNEDVFAFLPPSTADQHKDQLNHDHPQDHLSPLPQPPLVSFPSPTFNPYARYPADSLVGPSTIYFQPPPQSPPSTATDSNTHNNTRDGQYPLRRLNTATTASHAAPTSDSREVRVSLPASATRVESDLDMDMDAGVRRRSHQKRAGSSIGESLSVTPSMVDDDTEGSIK